MENSKRKIAEELGELPQISEDKLFEYFTPDVILREISKKKSNEMLAFYRDILNDIYNRHGQSMEGSLGNELANVDDKDKTKVIEQSLSMYNEGLVSIEILKNIGMTEEEIIECCKKHGDNELLLIDVFNAGLVSELKMFEDVLDMNFDLACELIKRGMSSRIIHGLQTTLPLIEMTRPTLDKDGNEITPRLTYESLVEIKDDIVTGLDEKGMTKSGNGSSTLLDLYLNDKLSYSELYGLANAGVITMDIANEINEKYNYIKDWKTLKEEGVKGHPLEGLLTPPEPNPEPGPHISKKAIGIDEDCIIDFYIALGAEEYLEIDAKKCPVFKDYMVIPVMDKKVAYLEGKDGRTYIVPLKIVLEQINNPKGDMDLIGNAPSRNVFNRQKEHIRSANHTRNWGRKIVKKTADLPSVPMNKEDAKKFIFDNSTIIKAIEDSYDKRKYEKVNPENGE